MTGVYMIQNNITGKKYIGSSFNVSSRMHDHLLELKRNRHTNKEMQEDFNKYGENSFSFVPLFETKDNEKTNAEYFLMAVLRTHNREYGYNYKDKGGTGRHLTRETIRYVSDAQFPKRKTYKMFRNWDAELRSIGSKAANGHQREYIEACLSSKSFKEAGEKLGVSSQWVHKVISDYVKKAK